jgi:hypothetical protein
VDRRGEEFDEAARGVLGHRRAGTASELRSADALAGKGMPVKTDRKDARSIAQLMRLGWFRPVHCKSLPAQEVRALLTARKLLQTKNLMWKLAYAACARLRAEGRPDDAANLLGPHPRAGRRPWHVVNGG